MKVIIVGISGDVDTTVRNNLRRGRRTSHWSMTLKEFALILAER